MHGLELLKKGLIWRIGNGSSVRIWRDPWIPRTFTCRTTTRRGRCRFHWVSDLLNSDGSDWDYSRILAVFNPPDADAIARIKLPSRRVDDVLAWHLEKSGIFSVKSVYRLGLDIQQSHSAVASSAAPTGDRSLWKKIWSSAVPPKISVFAWKLSKDVLPTKQNKFIRRLEPDGQCSLCGYAIEDSFHAVVECTQAKNLRDAMREHWPIPSEALFRKTGPDWFLLLLDRCTREQGELVSMIFWRAWTIHNNITHESGPSSVTDSVFFLLNMRESLFQIRQQASQDDVKGKSKCAGRLHR